ncbi:biotin--protein ligase isoform X2 [Carassius gibelio]|uniref:biotin--protein ligase isoform X2 n=1 Tax=Carassius gibelio TaxID=101364 RepID=UPI0022784C4F|nr:biotin--protein ligase isoform X2 [Carassius gibelio]
MLITLCYIYLWLRFQRHYTAVIRSALHRLSAGHRSFTFSALHPERLDLPREHALFLRLGDRVIYITEPQVLNWSDYCLPLAYSPGQPYRAIAEASLENFSRLGVAFMEDRLHMGNGLRPEKIVSVLLRETALQELFEQQQDQDQDQEHHQEEPELPSRHQHMDGHHLHLSSCHECQELENSTILSVKYASVENIPDLPDDCTAADEEEEEEEESRRRNSSGKPPNVLVFTGGCEEQFLKIRSLLVECVDTDCYAIYHLRPQQALSEPWLDNTLLLVLATDQTLTPQLQLRFLSYLSQGGKLLGLSSSLCPAGLTLRPGDTQKDHLCSLTFTKSDSTELQMSVLSSGSVFVRDGAGVGDVELWGEISGRDEREMAIVRVTHGADSGEAVLCQVRLETAPDAHDAQGFSELKMSNGRRYEVLTEILTSLGLSCELSQVPSHSPIYLLSTDTEQTGLFLSWLRAQAGDSGVLRSVEGDLKVVWAGDESVDVCEGERVLHTEPPESFSQLFSLQTYTHHLQTQRLGRTVLYADITSSTMDLLQGYVSSFTAPVSSQR